jgi:hypothetical protein
MLNALSLPIFVLVVIAVVGWFALGTQRNVRKGNDALRWLQDGLKLLGEKTNLGWLGSSVVELKIQSAKGPFRQAEVVVVLEPRDVPFLWWYYRARGRRDLLIVRGQLRRIPGFEFEALDLRCWSTHAIEKHLRSRNWDPVTLPESLPLVAYAAGDTPPATQLLEAVALPGCTPVRLGIRRTGPNLEVHWNLAEIQKIPAREVFAAIARIPHHAAIERE